MGQPSTNLTAAHGRRGILLGMSVDPLETAEETTERVTLDLPVSVMRYLERFAAYRNTMNEEQKRPVKKWTRKSAAEAFVSAQVRQVQQQMADTVTVHGEIPTSVDELRAYVRAVLARAEKPGKKSR